jgi:hypothetical protein
MALVAGSENDEKGGGGVGCESVNMQLRILRDKDERGHEQ